MSAVAYSPKYKVSEYRNWEGDWELWDGVAVSMSPSPRHFHQSASGNLYFQIRVALDEDGCPEECHALYEIDWEVNDFTVVRPDLLVVCEDLDDDWVKSRPELIAEILSPSTREKDLTSKRELYAREGVPFYLILDPDDQSAILLELEEKGSYRERSAEEPFELHPGCVLKLDVDAVFA